MVGEQITHKYETAGTIIYEYVIFILLIVTEKNDKIIRSSNSGILLPFILVPRTPQ
jgi:hypothetical protein